MLLLLFVQLGLQSSRVQLGLHTIGVGLASSGLGWVQVGLLLWGSSTQLGLVQLGCLHCTSVQLGSLSQLGVVQLNCLHCTSVQLGTYWGLFLGNVYLILGLY